VQRIAFVMQVQPGYEEEYKRRHDEIWPEMLEACKKAGLHNYSIYRYGLLLFAYAEVDNFKKMVQRLAKDSANAKWQKYMGPIMRIDVDQSIGFPFLLPEMFHMD